MNKKIIHTVIIGLLLMPACGFGLTIQSVDFMTVENKSRLQIGLDGKAAFDVTRTGDKLILRIDNVKIPKNLARPFITSEFETAVKSSFRSRRERMSSSI